MGINFQQTYTYSDFPGIVTVQIHTQEHHTSITVTGGHEGVELPEEVRNAVLAAALGEVGMLYSPPPGAYVIAPATNEPRRMEA